MNSTRFGILEARTDGLGVRQQPLPGGRMNPNEENTELAT